MLEKISILIPVYNRELYVAESISSAIKQSYSNLDIIIYNDGSTDKSDSIIKEFQSQDNRIIYINNTKNNGISHARNMLLDSCQTRYAAWLDSDDVIHPKRIEFQFLAMNNEDKLIFTDWHWYRFYLKKWRNCEQMHTTKAFATLMFPVNKTIRFDTQYTIGGEDWNWIGQMKKLYIEETVCKDLYAVRSHEDRIGTWKRKFKDCFTEQEIKTLSYAELIKKFQEKYGK